MRTVLSFLSLFVFIFILASIPLAIQIVDGELSLNTAVMWDLTADYIAGIFSGDAFYYQSGLDRHPNFLVESPQFSLTSLAYLTTSSVLAIILSLVISGWLSRSKKEWIMDIVGFIGAIPDFILVLFLQLGTVFFYQTTGYQLARVATGGSDDYAILLPLITLTIVPGIYLIRSLSERTYDVLTEDYIVTAKAKGLRKFYIFIQHVIRNVLPFLHADLHKVIAIMMSNLFIVEYLFNINGLSVLIFGDDIEYQFNLIVNTLFALIMVYIAMFWIIRLFIVLLERVFAHD